MKTSEATAPFAEEIKTVVDRASDVSNQVRHRLEAVYDSAARNVRHLRNVAEDAADETRHQIRRHPFTAVATAAGVGLALGAVAGWLIGRRRE